MKRNSRHSAGNQVAKRPMLVEVRLLYVGIRPEKFAFYKGLSEVVDIAAGESISLAVMQNGTVFQWGLLLSFYDFYFARGVLCAR
jgi:hypothetical protein